MLVLIKSFFVWGNSSSTDFWLTRRHIFG